MTAPADRVSPASGEDAAAAVAAFRADVERLLVEIARRMVGQDRKSTRLNSSH